MKHRSLAILAALMMALAVPATADAYETVTTASVNMRAAAGVKSVSVARLPPGAPVQVDYCRKGWCLGTAQGARGWVSARYLSIPGEVRSFQPPVVSAPQTPPLNFPFTMPDRGFHDYGIGRAHDFKRYEFRRPGCPSSRPGAALC